MRCPTLNELPPPPPGKTGSPFGGVQDGPWTEESSQLPHMMPDPSTTLRTGGSPWPRVSIVTPSYNQSQFIEETILSVKEQDYPNLEHIVVDGGSTDGTIEILRRYENEYNLRWVSEPDEGQSDAINKGFRRARGDIVGWLNSDDTYMPGAVHTAVEYLQQHPDVAWVYGDGYTIDEHDHVLWKLESRPFCLKTLICEYQYIVQPAVFFRHEVLEVVGLLDTSLHMTMDYDFFIRIGRHFKAGYIPKVLATRRLHSTAKSVDKAVEFGADAIATLDKVFADNNLPQDIVHSKNLAYSNRHVAWGSRCFNAGQYKEARARLLHALRLDPGPFQRKTVVILLLLFESLLGLEWYRPGERGRRKAQDAFRAAHGEVSVGWFL